MKKTPRQKKIFPFKDKKVYYCGSMAVKIRDPQLGYNLVKYIKENGGRVLNEHAVGLTMEEKFATFKKNSGVDITRLVGFEIGKNFYKYDMDWIDSAEYVIAVVDSPSLGVGMELMRAVLKSKLGLNKTPVLCLIYEEVLPSLSNLVKGASIAEDTFYLKKYKDLKDAKRLTYKFLTGKMG